MSWLSILSAGSLALWLYLFLGRDGFWRARPRFEDEAPPPPISWPPVVAVVPARDEAAHVGTALRSLLAQNYPGEFAIVLVDDHSADRTGDIARALTSEGRHRLDVIAAAALPSGWTGKLWAIAQGVRHAAHVLPEARYLLMADADIAHAPGSLARLVAKAEAQRLDLVSLMVQLRCTSFWERLLIPPFVFFFRKLYPFAAVNDPSRPLAAAAGGCILVGRAALDEAGGIEAIRDRLIDDVALAQAIKRRRDTGRLWLGLSTTTLGGARLPPSRGCLEHGGALRRHAARPLVAAAGRDRGRHGPDLPGAADRDRRGRRSRLGPASGLASSALP